MSELKSETIYFTHENGEAYAVDMYLKSEANKVIAELKDEIHNLKRSLIIARHAVAIAKGKKVSHKYRTKVEKNSKRRSDDLAKT